MSRDKRSLFERLTGSVHVEDDFYPADVDESPLAKKSSRQSGEWSGADADPADAQLTVDVYQTPEDIIVKTIVAGVKPEDVDISISRDSITIKGRREESRTINEQDYFHKELYWGSFSRTVSLPAEIDVDAAEAIEKHGLLILKLPKLNKERQAKVRVKSV